jgi:hypothetical protein
MPVRKEGADGMMPSAQSLRGYECAGRKRTFSKPDAMGDGIKIRSAQNPKRFPVILICSAKMTLKLSQEAVAVPFTIQNSCALSQDRRFQCSGLLLGGDDVAPLRAAMMEKRDPREAVDLTLTQCPSTPMAQRTACMTRARLVSVTIASRSFVSVMLSSLPATGSGRMT